MPIVAYHFSLNAEAFSCIRRQASQQFKWVGQQSINSLQARANAGT